MAKPKRTVVFILCTCLLWATTEASQSAGAATSQVRPLAAKRPPPPPPKPNAETIKPSIERTKPPLSPPKVVSSIEVAVQQEQRAEVVDPLMDRFQRIVEKKHLAASGEPQRLEKQIYAQRKEETLVKQPLVKDVEPPIQEESLKKLVAHDRKEGPSKQPTFAKDGASSLLEKAAAPGERYAGDIDDSIEQIALEEEEELVLGDAAGAPPPQQQETLYRRPPLVRNDQQVSPTPRENIDQQQLQQQVPPPRNMYQQQRQVPPPREKMEQQQRQVPPPREKMEQQYQRQPQHQPSRQNVGQQQQHAQVYGQQQQQQSPPRQQPPAQYQQQQQQYQQQRQQRPQYQQQQRPQQAAAAAPIWKSLWSRVEKSLDGLASVEDFVSERASQLTNQVTHKAKDLMAHPASILSSSRNMDTPAATSVSAKNQPRPVQGDSQQQQQPGMMGGRKFASVQDAPNQASTKPSSSVQQVSSSLASLYAMPTADNGGDDSDDDEEEVSATGGSRRNAWAARPIRAGASESDPAIKVATPGVYGRESSPFRQLQQDHQNRNQQEPQTDDGRKRPFAAASSEQQQQVRPQQPVRPTASYESVEESASWMSRLPLPSLPRMPSVVSKLLGRGSSSYRNIAAATMDVWKEEEQTSRRWSARTKQEQQPDKSSLKGQGEPSSSLPPLTDLLSRCNNGKSTSLLSDHDLRQCRAIGRNKAIIDVVFLGLVIRGVRECLSVSGNIMLQHSVDDVVAAAASAFVEASRGWAFYAFTAAVLASATNFVLFDSQIRFLTSSVGNTVRGASQYAQLYMRLVAGQPVEKHVPERMQQAARAQTVDTIQTGRLQTFVTLVLSTMVLMTVSVVQPIIFAILGSVVRFVTLPELRSWPVPWASVGGFLRLVFGSLGATIKVLLVGQFSTFMDSPMAFAFQLSFFAALVTVAVLPALGHNAKVRSLEEDEDEDEDIAASAFGTATTLSNLGVSSASRLGLLSKSGALEGTLERWRATLPPPSTLQNVHCLRSCLRRVGYTAVSTLVLLAPVLIYFACFAGVCAARVASSGAIRFNSIWDVSIMLLFALRSSWKSIAKAVESSTLRPYVQSFVKGLSEVVEEVSGTQQGAGTQLGSSISPTIGLSVKDLWAAHTAKRAWAVRGATFECHNGEVVAILGDDGAGKTRLLTAIAEALVNPAKRSLTTTKVRGSVSIGGLDSMKWDREQLKKKLGLFLNDVRTIADNAEFMSGLTLEEILEPADLSNPNPTIVAKAANQAMQITGLSATLLPQLPAKLSTVVTANENELKPSALRPRCHALSPSEWSKLLLARVLAQTIFDNENVSNAPLVGSLLLLDDLTSHLSEVEELKLLSALRKSGSATVFTSHKWASGRLADRIVVVNDGAVVESGTHNELLAQGPQLSMYAAKWHAMTTG